MNIDESIRLQGLGVRAVNGLAAAGVETLRDLITKTKMELLRVRNFGEASLNEVIAMLSAKGLYLGQKLPPPLLEVDKTLRDYFAAAALQGQVAYEGMEGCDKKQWAGMAYELAAAMLAERDREPPAEEGIKTPEPHSQKTIYFLGKHEACERFKGEDG